MSKSLYLDSNVLIYLAQPASEFYESARKVLDVAERRGFLLLTSSVGYAEYAAMAHTDGDSIKVEQLFVSGDITELPFGHNEALTFASLRTDKDKKIGAVDAMHVAAAISSHADYFITNDLRASKLTLPDLECLYLPKAAGWLESI